MSAPLVIAVPAKGRLQENAEAFFARAGLALVKPRGARDYRGAIAGFAGIEVAYLSAVRHHRAAGAGRRASRRHRRRSGARDDPAGRQPRGAARRARLRLRQCGGRGAAGLDRRAQHGRSRRRRDRVPPQARPQDAGRDQVREPHARLLRRRTASPTTASSRAWARPRARRPPAPPSSSSTSPPPGRRSPPTG